MIFTLLAAVSAGIAGTCLIIFFFDLISLIELEKQEEMIDTKRLPFFIRMFLPLASCVYFITKSDLAMSSRKRVEVQLESSSYDQAISAVNFLSVRLIMGALGALTAILFLIGGNALMGALIFFLLFSYPAVWLQSTVRKRHLSIMKALPNMLDLLTLSVEAGKDFLTALRDIINDRPTDPLGEEFQRTLREIQLGKSRQQALKDMARRVHHGDLSSVIGAIVQADELGISIGQILKVQCNQLRTKRFTRAETLANQAPVKILFPVVVFIFPSVFIILLGPIAAQLLRVFS